MFKKIFVATTNLGKLEEYRNYLEPLGYTVLGMKDLGISEEAPEQGETFLQIAENKGLFYSNYTKLPIVADDSGLEVVALDNFPGIKSNRWMEGSDQDKNKALLLKLKNETDRRSVFKTAIVYLHRKIMVRFEGELYGLIAADPRGQTGFGYDPIFLVPGIKRTLGELLLFEKNKISHRAKALQKLTSYLKKV